MHSCLGESAWGHALQARVHHWPSVGSCRPGTVPNQNHHSRTNYNRKKLGAATTSTNAPVHAYVELEPADRVLKPPGQAAHSAVLPPADQVPTAHVAQLLPPEPGSHTRTVI